MIAAALVLAAICSAEVCPERQNDFCWENDKFGMRAYGPGEYHKWSGWDVFNKAADAEATCGYVLHNHSKCGNWHETPYNGILDNYTMGASRGVGGIAFWGDGEWKTYSDWETSRVIHVGDDCCEFELEYPAFSAVGRMTCHVTLRRGERFFRCDVSFEHPERFRGDFRAGPGIDLDPSRDHKGVLVEEDGIVSLFEDEKGGNGSTMEAIFVSHGEKVEAMTDRMNCRILAFRKPSFTYWAGAAWSKSGEITTPEGWIESVRAFRNGVGAQSASGADSSRAAAGGKAKRCKAPLLVGIADICKEPDFVRVSKFYVDALAQAGHVPVVVPCVADAEACAAVVARLDVLLLAGGEDVSPERYGAERSPNCGAPNLRREEFEFALLEAAKARRLPLFGICRGVQMLNVSFGGTLWQDLPSEFPVHEGKKKLHFKGAFPWPYSGAATNPPAHTVSAVAGSRLAGIVGLEPLVVNSHHHQAVQKLAPGFRIAAYAPDGVPEAIECDTYPAAGVQFHPESILAASKDPRFDRERLLLIITHLDELIGMDSRPSPRTGRRNE